MYLRLTKAGSAYVALYSVDGVSWAQAAASLIPLRRDRSLCQQLQRNPVKAVPVVMSVNWFDVQQ